MIIDVPVPYRGFATLPGKRNEDPCLLVATVPVQIPDAAPGSLDLSARLTVPDTGMGYWAHRDPVAVPTTTVDYMTDGSRLFAPVALRNPHNSSYSTYPHAPTPPEHFARIGLGGTAYHLVRGAGVDGTLAAGGDATGFFNGRGRYPFVDQTMNRLRWESQAGSVSIHPETADLRHAQEAEPGLRDAAIAFARRAASGMLVYEGMVLEQTPGPVWRSLAVDHMPNQGPVVFLTAIHDPHMRFLPQGEGDDLRWASFVSPVLEDHARVAFEASGHSVVHVGGIEVMRPEVFTHDTAGLGLVDAARKATDPSTGVKMLGHATAELGMAWFDLRDSVGAIPLGHVADARLCDAAERFNALVGPERTDLWMAGYAAAARTPALLPGY